MSEIEGRVKYLPDEEKKETFGVEEDDTEEVDEDAAKDGLEDESLADKVKEAARDVQKELGGEGH